MTWYSNEQIEALQDIHLLEPAGVDEGVNLSLTTAVQQLQPILCAHQKVHTWGHMCIRFLILHKIVLINYVFNPSQK